MGNRCCIVGPDGDHGVYLHWHGDRTVVQAACEYCKIKGYRDPECDEVYAIARLCQVLANYIGGTLSIGICGRGDPGDHGVFTVGKDWEIINSTSPYTDDFVSYVDWELVEDIDLAQPKREQLGVERIQWIRAGCPEIPDKPDISELSRDKKAVIQFLREQNNMSFVEDYEDLLVMKDEDTLVFVLVQANDGILPDEDTESHRADLEAIAGKYLAEHSPDNCLVRFDIASINRIGNDQGLLRYHSNALKSS